MFWILGTLLRRAESAEHRGLAFVISSRIVLPFLLGAQGNDLGGTASNPGRLVGTQSDALHRGLRAKRPRLFW